MKYVLLLVLLIMRRSGGARDLVERRVGAGIKLDLVFLGDVPVLLLGMSVGVVEGTTDGTGVGGDVDEK